MTRIGQIVVCLLLIAGAYFAIRWINATEPTAQRAGATKETAMLVEVVAAERDTYEPEIVVVGTVEAEREVMLKPRVPGYVTERSDSFVPGGFVKAEEMLLKLDPTDYDTAKRARAAEYTQAVARRDEVMAEAARIAAELEEVGAEREQAEAELLQAQADLEVEQGRRMVAERDFELLKEKLDPQQRRLALREPQLAAARARIAVVKTRIASAEARLDATRARIEAAKARIEAGKASVLAAQAAVDKAQDEFERTTIAAPFDAQVLRRMVDKGAEVSTNTEVAHLVGIEEYWVIASVPLSQLRWIRFPTPEREGSSVRIRHEAAWGKKRYREGRVKNVIGALERRTRLARVVIGVKDPLALKKDDKRPDRPPLIVGSLVEVRIRAEPLVGVVRIDRAHLRKDSTVWVMKDDKLDIRTVDVVLQDPQYAYIRSGLAGGEQVVTTNLATVAPDAPLRTGAERPAAETGASKP